MAIEFQILIPLAIGLVALSIIAITRKYVKPEIFVIGLVLIGVCVSAFFIPTQTNEVEPTISSEDMAIGLQLAEKYITFGLYDAAEALLDELSSATADSTELLLARARCNLLQGNYSSSAQLYKQVSTEEASEELSYALSLNNSFLPNDNAMISYLSLQEKNPEEYGLAKATQTHVNLANVKSMVLERIDEHIEQSEDQYGEDLSNAVDYAANIEYLFSEYLNDRSNDIDAVDKNVDELCELMEDNSSFNGCIYLRLARIKGLVLLGRYAQIAGYADRSSSAHELIILAELYINGLVQGSDFTDAYLNLDEDAVERILDQCDATLENHKDSLSPEQYADYEEKLATLKLLTKSPALFTLEQDILQHATFGDEALRSKCYLSIAKIQSHLGNKELSNEYIAEALGSAAYSDDENYRIPMTKVVGIIHGTTGSEEVKNVAEYVDAAIDNSLPLDLDASMLESDEYSNYYDDNDYEDYDDDYNSGYYDDDEDDNSDSDSENEVIDFNEQMTNLITQSTATLNIGLINKDDFPEVKARVQIQSSKYYTLEEITAHLQVYDCGSQITEFTLDKMEFQRSRIILLCDISGSMSGSIDDLQEAVISFAEKMQENEEVCVIGFDDDIVFMSEFSSDPAVVASYADQLRDLGGTALFTSLLYAGEQFTNDLNVNNIVIAMTDGQDNNPVKEGDLYNQLGALIADKDFTVYTLGLGDGVDTNYLEMIADCGNGSFLYVDSKESLDEFFDFVHGQLKNQYILTYTAKNQTLNERKLEISLEGELGGAEKTYYLVDKEYTNEGSGSYNPYTVVDIDLTVNGFSTKFLYKSSQAQTIYLRGNGFDAGDEVLLRISDNVKYTLEATYVDSTTYSIVIPPEVATGVYDMILSIRGESITLQDELTIAVQGNEKTFRFGSYHFTALNSYVNDNGETVLSGNVIMNGWLHFKGDLKISSYYNTERVSITDNSGAYISYSDATAMGLAQYIAERGIPVSMGKFGTFEIYDWDYTPENYEDFPVEEIEPINELNLMFLIFENYKISVYPDMLKVQGINFHFDFPLQKQLMRNLTLPQKKLNIDSELLLSATRIGIIGEFDYEDLEDAEFSMVSLPLSMDKLSVKLDTLKGEYDVEASVKFKALKSMDGITFRFGVKNNRFDSIGLTFDGTEKVLMSTPIPISMEDFGFDLSGFSEKPSDDSLLSQILSTEISFLFNVNVASLNAYLPAIAELIDDDESVSLASLKDCSLKLRLKEFRLIFDAKVELCEILDIGSCHIALGTFDYTNALIGYYDEEQHGLQAVVTIGSKWETTNLSLDLTGRAELTLGYPYSGIWLDGDADFEIDWWIFSKDFDVAGDIMLGLYQNSSDNLQFSIIVRGTNTSGKLSGFHLFITKNTGLDIYKYN